MSCVIAKLVYQKHTITGHDGCDATTNNNNNISDIAIVNPSGPGLCVCFDSYRWASAAALCSFVAARVCIRVGLSHVRVRACSDAGATIICLI